MLTYLIAGFGIAVISYVAYSILFFHPYKVVVEKPRTIIEEAEEIIRRVYQEVR